MKQPWLKFYPSDWRSDPALRMCSLAARGLWMEMLCLMHEAEPCGSLVVNGRALTVKQISVLSGSPLADAEAALAELEEAGVFSREEDGTIYSRRIRRDVEKAARDRENGKTGGNPGITGGHKKGVNPPINRQRDPEVKGGDKAQKPEARGQNSDTHSPPSITAARGGHADPLEVWERFERGYPWTAAMSRAKATTAFFGLSAADQEAAITALPAFRADPAVKKFTSPVAGATYLRDRLFANYAPKSATGPPMICIEQDTPEGRALEAEWRSTKGKPPPWTNGKWYFPAQAGSERIAS